MANEKPLRRKPKPKHSAIHFTVWSINGTPVSQTVLSKVEAAVQSAIEEERLLLQVVRI